MALGGNVETAALAAVESGGRGEAATVYAGFYIVGNVFSLQVFFFRAAAAAALTGTFQIWLTTPNPP